MKFTAAPIAALLALTASTGAQANLLVNGSFEQSSTAGNYQLVPGGDSTTVTGWTTLLNGIERFAPASLGVGGTAQDGLFAIDICPLTFIGGGIAQTFATTPGTDYVLTFQASTVNTFGRTGDYISTVTVGSVTQQFSGTNLSATFDWKPFSVPFTATSATTTVSFTNTQDSQTHFSNIDAVTVNAVTVPESGTIALILSALALVGVAARRRK